MTFMEYYDPELFLSNIVKAKSISLSTLTYLFYKTIDSVQELENYGVFQSQIKLSNIYVNTKQLNEDNFIKLVGFSKARIVNSSGEIIHSRWNNVELLKINLKENERGKILANDYARPQMSEHSRPGDRPRYHDYIIAGEYKNKKSLYLPPKIKILLHSSDWKNRVYETHFGQLTIYSLAMSFLKAIAIILSMEEKKSLDYSKGTCYGMLKKFKLCDFNNSQKSFEVIMEDHKNSFKSFIEVMKGTIEKQNPSNTEVNQLIDLLENIDNIMFANDNVFKSNKTAIKFDKDTFQREMRKREFPVEAIKSSTFVSQKTMQRLLTHLNPGNEEKKGVEKEEEKVPENEPPNRLNESTQSKIKAELIAEDNNLDHINNNIMKSKKLKEKKEQEENSSPEHLLKGNVAGEKKNSIIIAGSTPKVGVNSKHKSQVEPTVEANSTTFHQNQAIHEEFKHDANEPIKNANEIVLRMNEEHQQDNNISRQEEVPLVNDPAFNDARQNNHKGHVEKSVSEYKTKQKVIKDTGRSDCNQFLFHFYRCRQGFKKTLTRSLSQ